MASYALSYLSGSMSSDKFSWADIRLALYLVRQTGSPITAKLQPCILCHAAATPLNTNSRITVEEAIGLVHVTVGGMFHLNSNSANYAEIKYQIVHNLSYMSKEEIKVLGCGQHRYGAIRK